MIACVNPEIIKWGRKRSGLSIEDLADAMDCAPEEIAEWESGEGIPSYSSLETLSSRFFKIPLAVFFFPEPPDIDEPINKFRRLPDYEFARLSSDSLHTIRLAQAYQDSLHDLMADTKLAKRIINDIDLKNSDIQSLARTIRKYLGVTVEQQAGHGKSDAAFKIWRHALEEVGIFTFKDSLEDKFISGFCLLDEEYPIIFVNNSNAFTRQTFTLFHELAHILYKVYGVTDTDETYLEYMDNNQKSLEVTCNKLASEILVPRLSFNKDVAYFKAVGEEAIPEIAAKYGVSREVILRRLLDINEISNHTYTSLSSEWNKDYLRSKTEKSGGDYYLTKLSYLGEGFTKLAFRQYDKGTLTISQLANHLNVKSKHIERMQAYLG